MTNPTNKNTINDLREIRFDQIRALNDKNNTPDIPRAKAIADISQVMINSVKSEIDFYKMTGQKISSSFLPDQPEEDIFLEKQTNKALKEKPIKPESTTTRTIIPTPTGYIHKSSCSK